DCHDDLAATTSVELPRCGGARDQCVVAAAAAQLARVELGAALADQDPPGVDELPAVPLDAQPLCGGVAAVARAGRTLLVCHRVRLLPGRDAGHLDPGQRLAVTLALLVPGLVLGLVDPDLRTLRVCDDLS